MISFNIEKTPPSEQDIAKEAERLRRKEKAIPIMKALLIAIVPLAFSIAPLAQWAISKVCTPQMVMSHHDALRIGIIAITATASMTFIFGYGAVEGEDDYITEKKLSMTPIKQEDCPEMLAMCKGHDRIRLYQNAVAEIGRPLTQGEFDAAKAWIGNEYAKKPTTTQQQACAMLSRQVQTDASNCSGA